jgi:hypothetical protein
MQSHTYDVLKFLLNITLEWFLLTCTLMSRFVVAVKYISAQEKVMFRTLLAIAVFGASISSSIGGTYSIDSAQSYVSAYSPVWVNEGLSWNNAVALPGEQPGAPLYSWRLDWISVHYQLSGTFDALYVTSPVNDYSARLRLSNISLTTNAPLYADFGLPIELSVVAANGLYTSSRACYQDYFYIPAGISWSCTGGTLGLVAESQGSFDSRKIQLAGVQGGLGFFPFSTWGDSSTEPPAVTDRSSVAGLYGYSLVAYAVPEPRGILLSLVGLLVLGASRILGGRRAACCRHQHLV